MVRAAQPHQTRCGIPSPPNRGSHVGEWAAAVVIAPVCHQYVLGLILSQHHMWVKFAVVSRLVSRVFLWVLLVSSLHKRQFSKFQFHQDRGPTWKPAKTVASSLNIYYLLTESEVITGKSRTESFMYWPRDSEVNTFRPRSQISL